MPIYEYRCTYCGNNIELLTQATDKTIKCQDCGKDMGRIVSLPGFRMDHTVRDGA